jgi:hypothetical protein
MVPWADQAALFHRTFAERGAILIESFEQWLKSQSRSTRKPLRPPKSSVRVGVGVYLVQDTLAGTPQGRRTNGTVAAD